MKYVTYCNKHSLIFQKLVSIEVSFINYTSHIKISGRDFRQIYLICSLIDTNY